MRKLSLMVDRGKIGTVLFLLQNPEKKSYLSREKKGQKQSMGSVWEKLTKIRGGKTEDGKNSQ